MTTLTITETTKMLKTLEEMQAQHEAFMAQAEVNNAQVKAFFAKANINYYEAPIADDDVLEDMADYFGGIA